METVTLSYNGISRDYRIGKTETMREKRIETLKKVFAEDCVIMNMVDKGELSSINFIHNNSGHAIGINNETTDKRLLEKIKKETDVIIPLVNVKFNNSI